MTMLATSMHTASIGMHVFFQHTHFVVERYHQSNHIGKHFKYMNVVDVIK